MLEAIVAWFGALLQTIKVWTLRHYYRFTSAWSWRGQHREIPHCEWQIPTVDRVIPARLYSNEQGAGKPLIIYIHGGGWVIGDLESHHPFCLALSEVTGCSVIALDYRLAPEHPFPAGQDDCLAATRWLCDNAARSTPCNGRLLVAGDSAGGNLAAATCLELTPSQRENIIGQVLIYPVTDHHSAGFGSYAEKAEGQMLTASLMAWFWDTYLGAHAESEPAAQRAFPRRSPGLASLPPTLLITAENDPLRDEGRFFAEQLQQAGVPVTYHHFLGADHGFACSNGPSEDFKLFTGQLADWLARLD